MIGKFDTRPDDRRLRQFGEFAMFFLGMVWAPLCLLRDRPRATLALWLAAVVVRLAAAAKPQWLRPVWIAASVLTVPIGWVVSAIALVVLWLVVVTPIGLVLRFTRRDPVRREWEPRDATTYWRARARPADASYLSRF